MRLSKARYFLFLLTLLASHASLVRADESSRYCDFNAGKLNPAISNAVSALIQREVRFAWKKDSVKVICDGNKSYWLGLELGDFGHAAGCAASFQALERV